MKVTYGITEEIYVIGNSRRTSFGIATYADADEDGTVTVIESVHDVTDDKEKLALLIQQCNRLELSVAHLPDAVEDFLAL